MTQKSTKSENEIVQCIITMFFQMWSYFLSGYPKLKDQCDKNNLLKTEKFSQKLLQV